MFPFTQEIGTEGRRNTEKSGTYKDQCNPPSLKIRLPDNEVDEFIEMDRRLLVSKSHRTFQKVLQKSIKSSSFEVEDVQDDTEPYNITRRTMNSQSLTKTKPKPYVDIFDKEIDVGYQSSVYFPHNNKSIVIEKIHNFKSKKK